MGQNVPPEGKRELKTIRYVDRINKTGQSAAESALLERVRALPDTMSPMPGAENQPIGKMDMGPGLSRLLTMTTRDMAREMKRPLKALDIGTYAGHSAGVIAKGMTYGGTVITCDITDKWVRNAGGERYWEEEGVRDRVDFRIAPASETLQKLLDDPSQLKTFDMVFIDADKTGYQQYYEQVLPLLRPGGKIIFDNALLSQYVANSATQEQRAKGRTIDPHLRATHAQNIKTLRRLNETVMQDPRVDSVLLDGEDGILIATKLDPREMHRQRPVSPQWSR